MPTVPTPASTPRRAVALFLEVVSPLAVFLVLSNGGVGANPVIDWIDRHRPAHGTVSEWVHAQKQFLHIETLARQPTPRRLLILAGSSSVVNDIDTSQLARKLAEHNVPMDVRNYGMTGFMAYELPILRDLWFDRKDTVLVYLYNSFSFGDSFHPQGIALRSRTGPIVSEFAVQDIAAIGPRRLCAGLLSECFFVVRYRALLQEMAYRLAFNRLDPATHDYDFAPGQPPHRQPRGRVPAKTEADTHWLRASYAESATNSTALGYRMLDAFAQHCRRDSRFLIVGPVPEAEFGLSGRYRQGIDSSRVDPRVATLARPAGIPCLMRDRTVAHLEAEDSFWVDEVHLHDSGRHLYSEWLGNQLAPLIRERIHDIQ
jgi:hypothetical protein